MAQAPYALPPGTTILGVAPGFSRNGNTPLFDIQCSDGQKYRTFDPTRASKAQAAVGQQGHTIMLSKSDDGRYTNFEDVIAPGGFVPQAAAAPPAQTFTPAPGFNEKPDAREIRISRGNAVNAAAAALAPLIGTGIFLKEDGTLDNETIENTIIGLARGLAPYIIEGPGGAAPAAAEAAPAAAVLPPGVTPEQVQAWVESQGAQGVAVGAPVPAAATEEAPATSY